MTTNPHSNIFWTFEHREGKVERINTRPFFSSISCCLSSLVKRAQRACNQAGQTTADSGKNWLSINSLCLTLANFDYFNDFNEFDNLGDFDNNDFDDFAELADFGPTILYILKVH